MNIDLQRNTATTEKIKKILGNAPRMIWVTFDFEGVHQYPAAADTAGDGLYDVSFLQYPHRHTFFFKVWIEVKHNDRDIEFIQFKRWCKSLFIEEKDAIINLNNLSCEMMADNLYLAIGKEFPNKDVWIEVSEDNENGTFIRYDCHTITRTL